MATLSLLIKKIQKIATPGGNGKQQLGNIGVLGREGNFTTPPRRLSCQARKLCLKYHAILKMPTGTTTTLATHLKRDPDGFVAYEKERSARKSVAKLDAQRPSVAYHFKPKLKYTPQKAQQMTKAIGRFIAHGMHFCCVVEEPGFVAVTDTAVTDTP